MRTDWSEVSARLAKDYQCCQNQEKANGTVTRLAFREITALQTPDLGYLASEL